MDDKITVAVLVGTTRAQRKSVMAAHYIAEFGRSLPNVEVVLVDPQDFTFPGDGNKPEGKDPRYGDITAQADAFFIVTPEYNHSFPGSLKRMIDSEYDNYHRKPVSLVGVSDGPWGGVRACEALLPVCHKVGMINIQSELYFPRIQDIFDESGQLNPEYSERYTRNVQKLYDELLWFARVLRAGRQNRL